MERLTDDRFLGEGFYMPKSQKERKEIALMKKPTYEEIYNRLGKYEHTGLSPDEIPHWIPVSERLPKESDGEVKIWDGEEGIGTYSEFSKCWYKGDMSAVGGNKVTHWMPLDKPPKGEK